MNKETRQFIFGLLLMLVCGLALAIQFVIILKVGWTGGIDYFLLPLNLFGGLLGTIYVTKNI